VRDILGYSGRTVVVSGAATGMGAAVARTLVDLGAEVYALDVKPVAAPVAQATVVDLRERASIDAAVAKLPPTSIGSSTAPACPGRRSRTSTPHS